jgi:8-oxo-dGTP pyrophosphatase MutT (NUDIX family)
LVLLTPLLLAASQTATFDDVVQALEADGYYVEPGSEPVDEGQLAQLVSESDIGLRPVILADAAVDGEQQLADDILNDLGTGTVVVVSPSSIGVSTDRADDAQVEAALDRADEQTDSVTDLVGYLQAFDRTLLGADRSVLGGRILPIALIVLLVVGVVMVIRRMRRRRQAAEQHERALREAREEVGAQISAVADRIVDLHSRVELAGEGEASRLYSAASETYTEAQRSLEQSTSPVELERVSDQLDGARWQLESVGALLDGREPPPEPERKVACFFDPNHSAGTQRAKVETLAGDREVHVCRECASKLEAGDAPQPRMIGVGGRQVPAAKAPRSYGGGGYDDLDDFTVIVGERRYPYGWGGYGGWGGWGPPRRRSWFGGASSGTSRPYRRSTWSSRSWSSGASRSRSVSTGGGSRSRSFSRGSASRSRSVSRGGGSRSRSVSRGGASRSRSSGRRGGGSRRR